MVIHGSIGLPNAHVRTRHATVPCTRSTLADSVCSSDTDDARQVCSGMWGSGGSREPWIEGGQLEPCVEALLPDTFLSQ